MSFKGTVSRDKKITLNIYASGQTDFYFFNSQCYDLKKNSSPRCDLFQYEINASLYSIFTVDTQSVLVNEGRSKNIRLTDLI